MFDIFGIRKRREERRLAKEAARQAEMQEKKRQYQERKKLITDYLDAYMKKEHEKCSEEYLKDKERAEKINSKCPKCGSINIVNHIRRTKGEIHGKGSISGFSSHSSGLFSSYSHSSIHGSSRIDGELDTLPVNKCNDCGNEWKVEEAKHSDTHNIFSAYDSTYPNSLYFRIDEYFELSYDPDDITEECNSLEEKREKYINDIASRKHTFYFYKDVPRYMIEYALYKGITQYHYREENLDERFGFSEDVDEYSYQMPDELWNIVKKMINWESQK